jgi:hypothetical protein
MQSTVLTRLLGASLGAIMALGVLAVLYAAAEHPMVESILHVRFVLGPDGFIAASGPSANLLAWIAVPAGAAISGLLVGPRAVAADRWAGPWMGFGTYAVGLLLASLIPDFTRALEGRGSWTSSLAEAAVGAPFMAALAGVILAPLLVCCVGGGEGWARVLRFSTGRVPTADADSTGAQRWDWVLFVLFTLVAVGWLLVGVWLGMMIGPDGGLLGPGGEFID